MGCHLCGRRQVDPVSGPSTWRRAVVAGEQVLVCPDCQVGSWTDGLDRCAVCGSTVLVKRLGEVSCRSCGASGAAVSRPRHEPSAYAAPGGRDAAREQLAAEVADALERVLRGGQGAGRTD